MALAARIRPLFCAVATISALAVAPGFVRAALFHAPPWEPFRPPPARKARSILVLVRSQTAVAITSLGSSHLIHPSEKITLSVYLIGTSFPLAALAPLSSATGHERARNAVGLLLIPDAHSCALPEALHVRVVRAAFPFPTVVPFIPRLF